jgi:hypothetical protein
MTSKKFWLGILAITLVFGMTVVGCNDASSGKEDPEFNLNLSVTFIPGNRNGESFTMSLIDKNNSPFVSEGGTITGDCAKAKLIVENLPSLNIRESASGGREYTCYLTLKIGNDTPLTSTDVIGIPMRNDGTAGGSMDTPYSYVFE